MPQTKAKAKRRVNALMSQRMKESWARRKAGNGNGNGHTVTLAGEADVIDALITPDTRAPFDVELDAYLTISNVLATLPEASRAAVRERMAL